VNKQSGQIGCAVIGYGAMHNFGWMHATWISATADLKLCAICDADPERTRVAQRDFPGVRTYNNTKEVYADPKIEMVTLVTPNFTHCSLALEAFANRRHVLTENAMCLDVGEANAMIDAAKAARKMLCVHHNRRHDGNYRLIREIADSGQIGEVFHLELSPAHFANPFANKPATWWADKERSGGSFFYYGPQAVDWILDLIPSPIASVTGFCHKLVWHDMTNEDQVTAIIRFENGTVANFTESHVDCAPKPFWRILGTKGAIVDTGNDATKGYQEKVSMPSTGGLKLITVSGGNLREQMVPYKDSDWHMFYADIASHLLRGTPVPITGECGRRVIGVLETARSSCQSGRTELAPYK